MIEYVRVKLYARCRFQKFNVTPAVYTSYYTEEGLHRPLFNNPANIYLPDNSEEIYNSGSASLSPRKGYEFSEIEVPMDYNRINGLSSSNKVPRFIALETTLETGRTINIYGWIDDIEPVAVKGPSANCRIKWHVDYWLTEENFRQYYNRYTLTGTRTPIQFGQGTVKRGPSSLARPDPSSPRKWLYDSKIEIDPGDIDVGTSYPSKGPYAIVVYTHNVTIGGITITRINVAYWGCNTEKITYSGNDYYVPADVEHLYTGTVEEMMGIASDSIVGLYVSPIPPYELKTANIEAGTGPVGNRAWYSRNKSAVDPYIFYTDLISKIGTNDEKKYIFMDPNNTIYATTPWGIEFQRIRSAVSVGTTGTWLDLSLIENITDTAENPGEGRIIQVPLLAVPVTDNQRSDYALTGQQDYDRTMARLQQQQNLQSGIAGSGQSALGGLIGGAMAGGLGGAAVGAVGGLALGIAGSYLNSEIQGYYDNKGFEAMDKLLSNQTANVIVGGGGELWYYLGNKWRMICLERDSESLSEIQTDQTERGYLTEAWLPDCSSLIALGGPLRIEGLEVKGDIDAKGRREISVLFARGVHLDLIT